MIISKYALSKKETCRLENIYPGLYFLRFKDNYDMCMTFLRYQEKYESPNPKFRNKYFLILDFMEWYAKEKGGIFSYTKDWSGFNLPDKVFEKNWYKNIPDKNKYDELMFKIYKDITKDVKCNKFYLIAAIDEGSIEHEIAHGFYYLNSKYKRQMNCLINELPKLFVQDTNKWLKSVGYATKVFKDETQAYLSANWDDKVSSKFKDVFKKEFGKVKFK